MCLFVFLHQTWIRRQRTAVAVAFLIYRFCAHVSMSRSLPLPQNTIITSYFAWPPSYFPKPVQWVGNLLILPPILFLRDQQNQSSTYSVKLWRGLTFSMLPTVQTSWTVHIMQINMYFGVYQQESVSALEVLILKLFMVNKVGCCGLLEL